VEGQKFRLASIGDLVDSGDADCGESPGRWCADLRKVTLWHVAILSSARHHRGQPGGRWQPLSLRCTAIAITFTLMENVKVRRRGATTISTKHQVTIPVAELRAAGLEAGERLVARADGPGRVILEREHDVLSEFAGALTGAYSDAGLDTLRDEWD
jgi:bifunctional DNA-binding transcriptional regulator/antitoxin component of YhaV-PrlF toxin-antitoxin module